jgi:cyclic-di-GMP-binding protein
MELKLSVPQLTTRVITEVELDPARLQSWLAALPLLNVAETGNKLFSSLSIHNRVAIDPERRVELLELYRYPVRQLSLELEKQYLGLPLPLSDRHKGIAERNRQFKLEMAIGYKRALLDSKAPEKPRELEKFRQQQARITERAIHYLTDALAASYHAYAPYPLGTWLEIHTLFGHAESLGVADLPVEGTENRVPASSVSHAYCHALLLDLSDPYHLPPRMINRIHQYLGRWAGLARLLPATGQFDPTCQFLVQQSEDRSGIVYTGETTLHEPERFRLLNTVELARLIHTQLTALQKREHVDADGLDPDFYSGDAQELLVRLIHAWGVHPKRLFRRNVRPGARVQLAIGLNAANFWLNGGAHFAVSSAFVGPMPQRTQVGTGAAQRQEPVAPEFAFSAWDVEDESAGGMALMQQGTVKHPVRVGEIVAARIAGDSAWRIAVLRWVRSSGPNNVEIGLQWTAPRAQAVVVKIISDEGHESDFLPAVLLPEFPALKQPKMLVTARGVYKPERIFYVDDGYQLNRARVTQPSEISHSFERFMFEIQPV